MAVHFYDLSISNIYKETNDCVVISFAIPPNLQETSTFTQGQYLTLKVIINGEEVRRSYSICSSPLDNRLSVAIKKVESGVFSTYANEQLKKGEIVQVMPPNGKFFTPLQNLNNNNYLAIASGSGITPILSIIKTTLATELQSSFTLVYNNRNRNSIIFFEAIEALKNKYMKRFTVIHILSREKTDTPLLYGRIDTTKLKDLATIINYNNFAAFFICGPEQMIMASKDFLVAQGIAPNTIHFELFATSKKIGALQKIVITEKENAAPKSNITIIADGRSLTFHLAYNGEAILDAAMQQGADLPFACKGGMCCTCKAKLLQGKVHMDINYALEPEEIAQGYILTCQAHPTTHTVVVDYDVK
jgi:ring-1,2-phenylacetyl-CoA epoxidase subunit PaaE